jgi:hypothetical protein
MFTNYKSANQSQNKQFARKATYLVGIMSYIHLKCNLKLDYLNPIQQTLKRVAVIM